MTQKCFCCGVVIVALTIGLVVPARAVDAEGGLIIVAATMAAAAIAVIVVASVPHRSKKIVITGCVLSGEKGMTITDQEDSKVYLLSGETTGIRPGDRMKLRGRRVRSTASGKTGLWEAKEVLKDFGVCQP
jgi:hypothetical protein